MLLYPLPLAGITWAAGGQAAATGHYEARRHWYRSYTASLLAWLGV